MTTHPGRAALAAIVARTACLRKECAYGVNIRDLRDVAAYVAELERENAELDFLRHEGGPQSVAAMEAVLHEAVQTYGKPGGPWNVPSDPGGWIGRAKAALGDMK
jgi:hypothetical protein